MSLPKVIFSRGTHIHRPALLALLMAALLWPAGAQTARRTAFELLEVGQWSNPPAKPHPLVAHRTYYSAAMKTEVGYSIYLPPGYATSTNRYPVVYWLPGGGCNEDPESPSLAPGLWGQLDACIRQSTLPPLIFIVVNGGRYTRYYDSLDGTVMMETTIIRELIPHVEATYRTIPGKAGRAIQGESMGGMGSLKFAFKYPELFSSVVSFCPALLDAEAHLKRNPVLIPALFNGDASLFTKDSPAALVVANADRIIRAQLAIKIIIGSEDGLLEWSEKLHQSLTQLKISHEYEIVGGVGHDFAPKKLELQLRALRYAAAHFDPALVPPPLYHSK